MKNSQKFLEMYELIKVNEHFGEETHAQMQELRKEGEAKGYSQKILIKLAELVISVLEPKVEELLAQLEEDLGLQLNAVVRVALNKASLGEIPVTVRASMLFILLPKLEKLAAPKSQ